MQTLSSSYRVATSMLVALGLAACSTAEPSAETAGPALATLREQAPLSPVASYTESLGNKR